MIGYVCCKNRMHLPNEAISAYRLYTLKPSFNKGLHNLGHAQVEETITSEQVSVFGEALKL